ncbi:hypothetical protein ARMGADRAFT_929177, partial [Armillaria gallica]
IPTWDGNTSTIVSWIQKIDDYSYWSEAINEQLERIIPMHLTGSAERWHYSLPAIHQGDIEQSWDQLRQAIVSYYMNCKFWEEQKAKATCAMYQECGNTRKMPSDYYIQKSKLLNLSGNWDDASLISEIMDGAPEIWSTILTTELYENTVEFQNAIWFHKKTLMNLSNLMQLSKFDKPTTNMYEKKNNFFEHMAWTNLVGASTKLPPPRFP